MLTNFLYYNSMAIIVRIIGVSLNEPHTSRFGVFGG